jgi:rare lipoprotein A
MHIHSLYRSFPALIGAVRWWVCASIVLFSAGCANMKPPAAPGAVPSAASESSAKSDAASAGKKHVPVMTPDLASPSSPFAAQPSAANATNTSSTTETQPASAEAATGWTEEGIASWYGPRFQGKRTANGERFNTNELTAAHKSLPFGTRVRVKSLVDGKEVIVRINDRGPFIKGRIIDLSNAAAKAIGMIGIRRVEIARLN